MTIQTSRAPRNPYWAARSVCMRTVVNFPFPSRASFFLLPARLLRELWQHSWQNINERNVSIYFLFVSFFFFLLFFRLFHSSVSCALVAMTTAEFLCEKEKKNLLDGIYADACKKYQKREMWQESGGKKMNFKRDCLLQTVEIMVDAFQMSNGK